MAANFHIVLVEPEISGNLGFVARVLMNFGFTSLFLVNPKCGFDDALIYAAHARKVLENAVIYSSLSDVAREVDFLVGTTGKAGHDYNVLRMPITPRMLVEQVKAVHGSIGLVFGRESRGLSNDELRLCDLVVSIPSSDLYPILNVSHAVAIVLYELYLSSHGDKFEGFRASSRVEKELLIKYFNRVLEVIDMPVFKKDVASLVFRHVVGRSFISGREAYTLMGVFRRMLFTLGCGLDGCP